MKVGSRSVERMEGKSKGGGGLRWFRGAYKTRFWRASGIAQPGMLAGEAAY